MKRTIYIFSAIAAVALSLASCQTKFTTFDGPAVIAFSDTTYLCPVMQGDVEFSVDIASTVAATTDRTFIVEAVSEKSNAVFGKHYVIENQTVTIKAGELAAKVTVKPVFGSFTNAENPYVTLRLVGAEDEQWEFNTQEAKVYFKKICPFNIDDYLGKCLISSSFLLSYTNNMSREAFVEKVEGEENTIVIRGMFEDGYDVKYRFDLTDPVYPTMELVGEQIIADTRTYMNYIWGTGELLGDEVSGYVADLDLCEKYVQSYMKIRVDEVGTVGLFVNIIEFGLED